MSSKYRMGASPFTNMAFSGLRRLLKGLPFVLRLWLFYNNVKIYFNKYWWLMQRGDCVSFYYYILITLLGKKNWDSCSSFPEKAKTCSEIPEHHLLFSSLPIMRTGPHSGWVGSRSGHLDIWCRHRLDGGTQIVRVTASWVVIKMPQKAYGEGRIGGPIQFWQASSSLESITRHSTETDINALQRNKGKGQSALKHTASIPSLCSCITSISLCTTGQIKWIF